MLSVILSFLIGCTYAADGSDSDLGGSTSTVVSDDSSDVLSDENSEKNESDTEKSKKKKCKCSKCGYKKCRCGDKGGKKEGHVCTEKLNSSLSETAVDDKSAVSEDTK
jgi:hypothetical protein